MKILVLDSTAVAQEGTGSPAQFSKPTIKNLRLAGHDVEILPGYQAAAATEADVVWTEWCNEEAYATAFEGRCNRLVIRVRGYDIWGPLHDLQWKHVHAVVFESKFLQRLFNEHFTSRDLPRPKVAQHVIPAGIDLTKFAYAPPASITPPVVALIARAVEWKGQQLVYEWAHQRPDLQIHMTTALAESNQRFMQYLHFAKPDNVTLYDHVDTCTWLHEIGATHLLSASMEETFGYTIAEAMALGIIPLVHEAPDNVVNWPNVQRWTTLADLNLLLNAPLANTRAAARAHIEGFLDAQAQTTKFAKVLFSGLQPRDAVPNETNVAPEIEDPFIKTITEFGAWAQDDNLAPEAVQIVGLRHAIDAYNAQAFIAAEKFARIALATGLPPRTDMLCMLGELALIAGELETALHWYKLAAVVPVQAGDCKQLTDRLMTRPHEIAEAIAKAETES